MDRIIPAFEFAGELLYQSSPRQRDIQMSDVSEEDGETVHDDTATVEGRRPKNPVAPFDLDDRTIEDETATGIEGGQGISQSAPPNPRHQTTPAPDPASAQRTNTAEAEEDMEEGLNEDSSSISSDNEVHEVMEGMKSWTKALPFPGDAEYLFPKETHQRRRRNRWKSRLNGLLGSGFGGGEGGTDSPSATGGPAPEGVLPIPRSLVGEGEDEGEVAEAIKTPWGGDEVFGSIDGQPEGAVRAETSMNSGPRGSCVPCMIHHTDCVYEVGAGSCGECLGREERCVPSAE